MTTRRGPQAPLALVTTDPELDDLNSMLRLLLYSNEIDLVGLVYSSSEHHHRGDPELGVDPKRWPADDDVWHIDRAVDAYAEVHGNLVRHDSRYPTPDHLRSLVRVGNVLDVGDTGQPTPGSDLIVDVLLEADPRPVFVQAWGGTNTIARALLSIEEAHAGSADWEALRSEVVAKTVITSFGVQDATFEDHIAPNWPDIQHRQVATTIWGYFAWNVVHRDDAELLSAEWTREHVSRVGPIGASYRVWGDGRQMAAGFDREDYFGVAGRTPDELAADGYWLWCPPREPGAWISEGDSSNFAPLIDNGLRSWEHPNHGGWGGRQELVPGTRNRWDGGLARDRAADGSTPDDFHASRWFRAIQHDFAARLRWSVTDDPAGANHHPVVRIRPGLDVVAAPGASIELVAEVSDPDGDDVTLGWWCYAEAGTYPGDVALCADGDRCVVDVPADARPGHTVHVIAEATDGGVPPLTRYRRIILTIDERKSTWTN